MRIGRYRRDQQLRSGASRTSYPWAEISERNRLQHLYIIGKTGSGKSTLLENMISQDIRGEHGVFFLDPHGESSLKILSTIPPHRRQDVILFDPSDPEFAPAFNPLENVPDAQKDFMAEAVVEALKSIWDGMGPNFNIIVKQGCRALMDYPGYNTLVSLIRLVSHSAFRRSVIAHCQDPIARHFWEHVFEKEWDERDRKHNVISTYNKVLEFGSGPKIRDTFAQPKSKFDFSDIMDHRKIFIARLPRAQLGKQKVQIFGSMLLANLHVKATQRAPSAPNFYCYIDEVPLVASSTIEEMLAEERKFKVGLTLSHQWTTQLTPAVRDAVFGSCNHFVSFPVGPTDADILAKQFDLKPENFTRLEPFTAYLRSPTETIYLEQMPLLQAKEYPAAIDRIRAQAHTEYSLPRADVEDTIHRFFQYKTARRP